MTREEAINHIKYGIIESNYPLPKEIGMEALDMAIKALEKTKEEKSLVYDNEEPSVFSCENCKYELLSPEVEPCCDCKNSHKNYFEAKTSKALEEPSVKDVLDKVRAEIVSLTYYWDEVNPKSVKEDVLEIIDKYKAEKESEE